MSSQAPNKLKELLWEKVIDGNNDVFKVILMGTGFVFSIDSYGAYADVSANELATAYGYTVGGATLTGVTITKDDTEDAGIIAWNNVTWSVSGGDLQTVGAIIYDDTVASPVADPIIAYIDFGGTLTTYDGGVFTLANPAVAIL